MFAAKQCDGYKLVRTSGINCNYTSEKTKHLEMATYQHAVLWFKTLATLYMLIINIKNPKKKLFSESTVKDAGMF